MVFTCYLCEGVTFKQQNNLTRHILSVHNQEKFACDQCEAKYSRSDNLKMHKQSCGKRKGDPIPLPLPKKIGKLNPNLPNLDLLLSNQPRPHLHLPNLDLLLSNQPHPHHLPLPQLLDLQTIFVG